MALGPTAQWEPRSVPNNVRMHHFCRVGGSRVARSRPQERVLDNVTLTAAGYLSSANILNDTPQCALIKPTNQCVHVVYPLDKHNKKSRAYMINGLKTLLSQAPQLSQAQTCDVDALLPTWPHLPCRTGKHADDACRRCTTLCLYPAAQSTDVMCLPRGQPRRGNVQSLTQLTQYSHENLDMTLTILKRSEVLEA